MPYDEHGVKWSCEPCIRGHRSSKCAHFDRLMVSVGKAGRPLSKCPHVEGSCNCKKLCAFMVAIPKGTGCLCRPVYKMLLDENGPTPAVSRLPLDLTSGPGTSPSKIQKSGKKHVKPAPEQVNKALNSIPEFHQHVVQNGFPAMSPYIPQSHVNGYSHNIPNGILQHSNVFPGVHNALNGLGFPSDIFATGNGHSNNFQPPMQPKLFMPVQARGACCPNGTSNGVKIEPDTVAQNRLIASPLSASSLTEASPSTWQSFPSADGHLASVDGIINGLASNLSEFAPIVTSGDYTHSTNIGFVQYPISQPAPVGTSDYTHHLTTTRTSGASHNCNCGPKCNCFACPDHPYNDVTVQHVQEMGRIIAQDVQTAEDESNYEDTQTNGYHPSEPDIGQSSADSGHQLNNGFESMAAGHCCGFDVGALEDDHDTQAPDSFTEEHLMVPDAYYTYEYQIGLPGACAGEAGNCQCGPSCSCLGCLTHGNT